MMDCRMADTSCEAVFGPEVNMNYTPSSEGSQIGDSHKIRLPETGLNCTLLKPCSCEQVIGLVGTR